jgi:hypothetical protein
VFYQTIRRKHWKLTTKGVPKCQIKKTIVNKAAANKVARLEEVSRGARAASQAAANKANKVVVKVARLEEVSRAGSQAAVSKADRLVKTPERNRAYVIRCRDSILGTILKQPYIQEAVMKGFIVGLAVGVGLGFLFAPGRGEDTRRELNERLNNFGDEARRHVGNVTQQVRDEVNMKKDQVKDMVTKVSEPESRIA